MSNQLFYGDNLDILRDHIADESVDLIYLDPPFNSNRDYNILFKEKSGEELSSQIEAFTDTWQWNQDAEYAYDEITTTPPAQVASMIEAMRSFIGTNDTMAYLVMMAQWTFPAIQIMTVEEPLAGKEPRLPYALDTFAKANRVTSGQHQTAELGWLADACY